MDGLGVGARGLGHALGGPARGGGQGEGHAHAGEGVGDAADDGGLAGAGAAGDDHDAGVQGPGHRFALAFGQGEPQLPFVLAHVPEGVRHRGFRKLHQLLGDAGLHAGDIGQEHAPLLAHELLHQGALRDHGVHGVRQQFGIHTQKTAGLQDQLLRGQIGVAVFVLGILQSVFYTSEQAGGGVGLEAGHPLGDGVCGHEADAVDIVDELIGVLLDLGEGQIPVGLVHAVGLVHGDPVGGQGHQDVPHRPILAEGAHDHLQLLAADAGHLQQSFRLLLHDLQGVHAEAVHDEPGHGGAHALDGAARQIVFDGDLGGGGQGLGVGHHKLLAVLGMIFDGPLRPELFPGGGEGQGAAEGGEALLRIRAEREDGVPVLGVPEYDPVDDARDLHITPKAGSRFRPGRRPGSTPPIWRRRSSRPACPAAGPGCPGPPPRRARPPQRRS